MSAADRKITFTLAEMPSLVGQSFTGDWLVVERERIKEFDSSTYVDDDQAGYSFDDYPADEAGDFLMFEGLHTLGMVLALIDSGLKVRDKSATGLVYGLDRVRFTAPVYADDRLRARGEVTEVMPKRDGYLMRVQLEVEIEGRDRPAYVADLLLLFYPQGAIDLSIPGGTRG